jgi:hypothetical protein
MENTISIVDYATALIARSDTQKYVYPAIA